MKKFEQKEKEREKKSRSAAPSESGIQTALAHSVSTANPGQEALETETVAAVRRGSVPAGVSIYKDKGG